MRRYILSFNKTIHDHTSQLIMGPERTLDLQLPVGLVHRGLHRVVNILHRGLGRPHLQYSTVQLQYSIVQYNTVTVQYISTV